MGGGSKKTHWRYIIIGCATHIGEVGQRVRLVVEWSGGAPGGESGVTMVHVGTMCDDNEGGGARGREVYFGE